MRKGNATCVPLVGLFLVILAAALSLGQGATSPAGDWQGRNGDGAFTLTLNPDGTGSLNGNAIQWVYRAGTLRLTLGSQPSDYKAALTPTTMTLSGNSLKQPLVFTRSAAGAGSATAPSNGGSDALPIAGDPPLTQDMVDRGARLMEWLLDARLTAEQHQQFQDSQVRTWKAHDAAGIAATLDTLKFHADLGRKTEAERNAVRDLLQSQYLDLMRKTPNDVLSQWALAIYYAAHRPIAQGNPPLTRQVADAYAEVTCFAISEVVGGKAFTADKALKDRMASAFIAQYPSLSPDRQKELSQYPAMWSAISFAWPTLPEAERANYRQQWTPAVRALLDSAGAAPKAGTAATATASAANPSDVMRKFQEQQQVHRMLFNMNQDFLHKYYIAPGTPYLKYAW